MKTILVVEDDEAITESLVEFLESENYVAKTAPNGLEALKLLNASTELPSAIILDLMMPVMDGIEFRKRQVSDPRLAAIPVVLVSADNQINAKKSQMGLTHSLRKPIDIDLLSDILKRY